MKTKRMLLLGLVFSMLCTVTAFADSGTYQGYSKVKLRLNNADVADDTVPPFVIDGTTVIPLRQAAETLHAIVKWDSGAKVADIFRPNVSMFFSEDVSGKDYTIKKPFSLVENGKNLSFVIFVQVDSLKTTVNGFEISVEAPDGSEIASFKVNNEITDDIFWYTQPLQVKFSQSGNYTVKFSFLYDGEYRVVSEKTIKSE